MKNIFIREYFEKSFHNVMLMCPYIPIRAHIAQHKAKQITMYIFVIT